MLKFTYINFTKERWCENGRKKVTKISLSTFFLILAIIIIIVMGIFIYKLYTEKSIETEKSTELEATINSLNEKINSISETINSNTSVEKTDENTANNNSLKSNNSFTDEQVQLAISNYLELYAHAHCSLLLQELSEKGSLSYNPSESTTFLYDGTIITSIKFSDYKKTMLNYVSENEFEKNWSSTLNYHENSNGYLTMLQGGGGLRTFTINNITKINDSTYTANTYSTVSGDYPSTDNYEFSLKNVNNNCVVDSFK